ncbi:hypothetical protein [Mucilaginibacter gilvus]|uniref:Uncharacterized protein n=1 Tax=Mucilaginibacter gilvus TaxID=2305909 RepID=A0A3S3YZ96_9SPHI|nr:hypothetical protein [Mucilaginibacter gilvus]RWY53689.1 hypothetical protein EPL05_06345 [Mucilaginibacter gilvus]
MEDVIIQVIVTAFLVLMPLFGPKNRRREPDFKQQTQIHSIYGINEDGRMELLKKEGEDNA